MKKAWKALDILKDVDTGVSGSDALNIIEQALADLEELKSWRDELNETIQDLISKAKHWEEKENKTDFYKGIAMSKEMTPIKSFTRLVNKILGKESTYSQQDMIVVEQSLTELEALKRYPTSEEVREALQLFWGNNYKVDVSITDQIFIESKKDKDGDSCIMWDGEKIYFDWMPCYPPHLITLIGRFYEGMEKKE